MITPSDDACPEQASGDCIVTRLYDVTDLRHRKPRIRIDQADPLVKISDELLRELDHGYGAPDLRLDGEVLTINAVNRRVVYRIDFASYDPYTRTYLMRWPD